MTVSFELGPIFFTCSGLGQSADGGWFGSGHKMDPRTTLDWLQRLCLENDYCKNTQEILFSRLFHFSWSELVK